MKLHTSMLKVPFQSLGYPQVHYAEAQANRNHVVKPVKPASRWQIPQSGLFHTTNRRKFTYILLVASGSKPKQQDHQKPNQKDVHEEMIEKHVARCALQAIRIKHADLDKPVELPNLKAILQKAETNKVDLVILILPKVDKEMYGVFKNLADRRNGLRSLCMVAPSMGKKGYMENVSMKINLKFGGINHTALPTDQRLPNTMVLGADLIHTMSGTIAAVVGSVDSAAGNFLGCVRLQDPHHVDHEVRLIDMWSSRLGIDCCRLSTHLKTWFTSDSFTGPNWVYQRQEHERCPERLSTIVMVSAAVTTRKSVMWNCRPFAVLTPRLRTSFS